jgi:hypothetical protein
MNKILILVILIFGFSEVSSQVTVSISDTLIPRGDIYQIPVNIKIEPNTFDEINTCSVKFTYDARVINIQGIVGGNNYLMQCATPLFDNDYEDLQNTILTISCDDCTLLDNGQLCMISIQGLVAPDSLTKFELTDMTINGDIVEDIQSTAATIKVPGTIINQEYPEGLGLNFPNPCHYTTVFPFNINETSKVHFEIYNASGRSLLSSKDSPEDVFAMYYLSKNGVVYISDLESELNQGSYFLRLYIPEYEISSGLYYLKMKTKSGEYNGSFLIIR